jgi:hypothetical protein
MPRRELKYPHQVANAPNRGTALKRLGLPACICYLERVNTSASDQTESAVWGPYPNYDDIARFEYGRLLWRSPQMRLRLLNHWMDARHPYHERFLLQRQLIQEVLSSQETEEALDYRLRSQGTSLRCVAREIPPVFGSFF